MKQQSIVTATRSFEDWLADHIPLVRKDISRKHAAMATDPFVFLRATFYRWAQVFPDLCADLMEAPVVRGLRFARRELQHMARRRRSAHLGHQRFRRSLPDAVHHRPRSPGNKH